MALDGKLIGIIISAMLTIGGGLYHLIDAKNKAEIELKLQTKYEQVLIDNITYRLNCN